MAKYRTKRPLPTIFTVILIIVAIVGLVAIARFIFFSGGSTPRVIDTSRQQLLSSSEGRAVSMTVRGPIVADENFRSYTIVVSPSSRSLTTYSGYLEAVLDRTTYTNNIPAYEEFVNALNKANMVAGEPFGDERDDVLGVCATGRVIEFALLDGGDQTEMLWTSTCSGSRGSLRANADQLGQLFRAQIPDSREMLREISL